MHVSLAPEIIFYFGSIGITNSILTTWIVMIILLLIALIVRLHLQKIPGRLQSAVELTYSWLLSTSIKIVGEEKIAREVFPYIITLFLFIVTASWSGLLPGVGPIGFEHILHGEKIITPLFRAPTADMNMAIALALFSMFYIQFLGLKHAGIGGYLKRFINFESPIGFFVGFLEVIGEFTRLISFTFRLFGNIFAGEVLISVMFFLTIKLAPYIGIIPLPFFILELAVGIIQAFIFCFLTLVFTSSAIIAHDEHGHDHGGEDLEAAHKAAESQKRFEQRLSNSQII